MKLINRYLIVCIIGLMPMTMGCGYLNKRLNDFQDCFKISLDVGALYDVHVKAGPIVLSSGFWSGYCVGNLSAYGWTYWEDTIAGFPFGVWGNVMTAGHAGKLSRSCLRDVYAHTPSKRVIENREYIFCVQNEMKYYPFPQDYFWIEISLRLGIGFTIGFNLLEFADFIMGIVGIDILDDDDKKYIDYAIIDRKSNRINDNGANRIK